MAVAALLLGFAWNSLCGPGETDEHADRCSSAVGLRPLPWF